MESTPTSKIKTIRIGRCSESVIYRIRVLPSAWRSLPRQPRRASLRAENEHRKQDILSDLG